MQITWVWKPTDSWSDPLSVQCIPISVKMAFKKRLLFTEMFSWQLVFHFVHFISLSDLDWFESNDEKEKNELKGLIWVCSDHCSARMKDSRKLQVVIVVTEEQSLVWWHIPAHTHRICVRECQASRHSWMPNSETDSDGGFECRNDTDEWFPKSQSLLHHQHSNAHTPLPQKSIFNLSDLPSLHAPPPPSLLSHSLCISLTLKGNRPGIPIDSKGSAHYKLVGQLFVSPVVRCHNGSRLGMQRVFVLHINILDSSRNAIGVGITSRVSFVAIHFVFSRNAISMLAGSM